MILVTGGTGLTGSHLLYELASRGEAVRAVRRSGSSTAFTLKIFSLYTPRAEEFFDRIAWVDADLLCYDSLVAATVGVETVFHTGATVSFRPSDAEKIIETNVTGTANLVDACLQNQVSTLCHVSSIAALGEPNAAGIVDEACIWSKSKGQSAYAKSKFWGEMEVWRGAEVGLRVIIVNPSVIIGPGRWSSGSGQLFSRLARGMPFYTTGTTGYVDARDVARAMVQLAFDPSVNNERFILNSQNLSYKEVFTLIALSVSSSPPRIRISQSFVDALYPLAKLVGFLTGNGSSISKQNLRSAFSKTFYSSEKIKNRLGFKFIPIADSVKFAGSLFSEGF